MATIELTTEGFDRTASGEAMVVVDFWAPWCGPCRQFAPVFEAASDKFSGAVFGKVNVDEQQELASMFGVRSIPTLMIMREKVVLFSQAGSLPTGQLSELLERAAALDMAQVHREIAEGAGDAGDAGGTGGA